MLPVADQYARIDQIVYVIFTVFEVIAKRRSMDRNKAVFTDQIRVPGGNVRKQIQDVESLEIPKCYVLESVLLRGILFFVAFQVEILGQAYMAFLDFAQAQQT